MPNVPELAYFTQLIHGTIDQLHLKRLENFEPPAEMPLNSYHSRIRNLYGLKWRNFQDATHCCGCRDLLHHASLSFVLPDRLPRFPDDFTLKFIWRDA